VQLSLSEIVTLNCSGVIGAISMPASRSWTATSSRAKMPIQFTTAVLSIPL